MAPHPDYLIPVVICSAITIYLLSIALSLIPIELCTVTVFVAVGIIVIVDIVLSRRG